MGLTKSRLSALLKKSGTSRRFDHIHGLHLTSSSLHRLPSGLPTLLVRRTAEAGDMACAYLLFSSFPRDDVALYNAMIRGCSFRGPMSTHWSCSTKCRAGASRPTSFPHVLNACAQLRLQQRGEGIHCRVLKGGLTTC